MGRLGKALGIGLVVLILGICASVTTLNRPSTANAPECAEAVAQVQQYKAPGQRRPVIDNARAVLAAERRPVEVIGWSRGGYTSGTCIVRFQFNRGNETQTAVWWYEPASGKVQASTGDSGQLAKQLSGW